MLREHLQQARGNDEANSIKYSSYLLDFQQSEGKLDRVSCFIRFLDVLRIRRPGKITKMCYIERQKPG